MTDFRIIPAQHRERTVSGIRYGLLIPNHPRGTPGYDGPLSRDEAYRETGSWYRQGDYIASWETWELACAAAYALGMTDREVQTVSVYVPENLP